MKRSATQIMLAILLIASAVYAQNPLDGIFGGKPKPGQGQPSAGAAGQPPNAGQQPASSPAFAPGSVRPRAGLPGPGNAGATSEWTFLVYMASDNNVDKAAASDVEEMEKAGSSPEVKVVAFMDRSGQSEYNPSGWKGARQALILNNPSGGALGSFDPKEPTCEVLGEVDSGDRATFQRFLLWGTRKYPARHYALVIWNHGGGWRSADLTGPRSATRDICWDYSTNNRLFNKDLRETLEQVGVRYEIIAMNACLMAMIEVAYEFKDLTGLLLASTQNMPATGLDYTPVLTSLRSKPAMSGMELAQRMIQTYGNYYQNSSRELVTLSIVRSDQIPPLTQSLNVLMQQIQREAPQQAAIPYRDSFAGARKKADCIKDKPAYVDLGAFLGGLAQDQRVSAGLRDAASQAIRSYQNAIVTRYSKPESAGTGMSIYFPDSGDARLIDEYTASNITFAKNCYWPYFIQAFVKGGPLQLPTGAVPTGGIPSGGVPTGGVPTGGYPSGGGPGGPNTGPSAFTAGVQIMGMILTDSREGRNPVDNIQPGVTYWVKFRSQCSGAQPDLKETVTIVGAGASGRIIPGTSRYSSYRFSNGDNIYAIRFTAPRERAFRIIVDHFVSDAQSAIRYSDFMSRDYQIGGNGAGVESSAVRSLAQPKSLSEVYRNGIEEKEGSKVLAPPLRVSSPPAPLGKIPAGAGR